jgi:hypothetical protein
MNKVNITKPLPLGVPASATRAQMNNNVANAIAAGDPRMNMKTYDRPGMSRGRAAVNQAGIDSAQRMSERMAQAYEQDLRNRQADSQFSLQSQTSQEQNAQALGALNQQNAYANQLASLQRQQAGMNLFSSLLGGLLS